MSIPATYSWHALCTGKVVELLDSDTRHGLNTDAVRQRRLTHGENSLPHHTGPSDLIRFILQFHQPLLYILLISSIITALMGEWVDASVIFGVLLINAIIGYFQESKAARALEALVQTTFTEARVLRSGGTHTIPSTELVPGDIVLLQSGEKVPADLRLIESRELQIDESALTGESIPSAKFTKQLTESVELAERQNMAYASTLVTYGQATGIVVATGSMTEVGRISELILTADVLETPLTKKISQFSRVLLIVILALAAVTFCVGWWRAQPTAELFMATVALAVGAIPEGLPAAVTITLAIGVARMARRRAIIRKLAAVETLGSTTVICSDKTGTLTVNEMTVREIYASGQAYDVLGSGYQPVGEIQTRDATTCRLDQNQAAIHCLRAGRWCNDAQVTETRGIFRAQGDPTESALITAANKARIAPDLDEAQSPRVDAIPFESQYQYMATLHRDENASARQLYVKGAAEVILARCSGAMATDGSSASLDQENLAQEIERMARDGLRALAFAGKSFGAEVGQLTHESVRGLTFYGLQGMMDPARSEAKTAIAACQQAGIRVKMITGDHPTTALAIARQLGINGLDGRDSDQTSTESQDVTTSREIEHQTDTELIKIADQVTVFARATPELKLRLVRALQANGNVVAMTGDGVNDAPALKQADIGVAMGVGGTEVAKEAADMVLTDDNFASIEAAVEEGRGVFDNLTKYIVWTLPTSMGEGLVVLAAVFAGVALPILPAQILWINMTTAVLLGLMLAFEPMEPDVMSRPPRNPHSRILTTELSGRILMVSLIMLIGAFGSFHWAIEKGYGEAAARTIAANVFVFVELFYLFNCRSLSKSMFQQGLTSNRWIGVGVSLMVLLQIAFTYLPIMNRIFRTAPISWDAWWRILLTGLATYALVGLEKSVRQRIAKYRLGAT